MSESKRGVITLEACVSVLSFLILMLLLSSLFVMFMAQNATAHAVLQTTQSLSIDSYAGDKIGTGGTGSVSDVVVSIGTFFDGLFGSSNNNSDFANNEKWYDVTSNDNSKIAAAAKTRFIAYISGGDEQEADKTLKHMNVVDGISGIDFSESYIANNTLYVIANYKLQYNFNIWNVGDVDVKQEACSKLWKAN